MTQIFISTPALFSEHHPYSIAFSTITLNYQIVILICPISNFCFSFITPLSHYMNLFFPSSWSQSMESIYCSGSSPEVVLIPLFPTFPTSNQSASFFSTPYKTFQMWHFLTPSLLPKSKLPLFLRWIPNCSSCFQLAWWQWGPLSPFLPIPSYASILSGFQAGLAIFGFWGGCWGAIPKSRRL